MKRYSSNQDFYDHIDEVVEILRSTKHAKSAEKIHYLIHKVAWTTASELFGELRNEFETLLASKTNFPGNLRDILKHFIKTLDDAWNKSNLKG